MGFLQGRKPGHFIVEETSLANALVPSGFICQRWGVAWPMPDGSVVTEPEPASHRPGRSDVNLLPLALLF